MIRLFVNADDAGLAASTDDAILACAEAGIVRCATVVANGRTAPAFVRRARDAGLDLGLHFNLTEGVALGGPYATLTDGTGRFHGPKSEVWRRAAAGEFDGAEVEAEASAQWERLRALGAEPSHVDGHNHVHLFPAARRFFGGCGGRPHCRIPLERIAPPGYLPAAFREWALALGREARRTDRFTGYAFARLPTAYVFLLCIPDGVATVEFMVHPGSRPGAPFASSPSRDRERDALCLPVLREALDRYGILPSRFADLPCA